VGLRRVRGPRTPPAMTGSGEVDTVETWRPINVFPAFTGLRRSDSTSMSEGGDGNVRDTPEGDQRPHRT